SLKMPSRTPGRNGSFFVRRASALDAPGIAAVLETITSERIHSAIEQAWTADEQRQYLESLSDREAFHVAVSDAGDIIGYQSFDRHAPLLTSMSHVGQVGTFLVPQWRRHGIGRALFQLTRAFAQSTG